MARQKETGQKELCLVCQITGIYGFTAVRTRLLYFRDILMGENMRYTRAGISLIICLIVIVGCALSIGWNLGRVYERSALQAALLSFSADIVPTTFIIPSGPFRGEIGQGVCFPEEIAGALQ